MFQDAAVALTSLTPEQHRSTQPSASAVIPIPTRQPQTGAPFDRLPEPLYATRVALDRKLIASMPPTVNGQVVAESASGDYAMLSRLSPARKATPTLLGDLPVICCCRAVSMPRPNNRPHTPRFRACPATRGISSSPTRITRSTCHTRTWFSPPSGMSSPRSGQRGRFDNGDDAAEANPGGLRELDRSPGACESKPSDHRRRKSE
jgi:hypothetical protein